jgi:hypothetical protein
MNERGFKGIWMCAAVYLADDLTPIEKLMLVEIDSLTNGDCACYASNDHFASILRITESRANHLLSGLAKKGYVIRTGFDGRTTYRVVAPQFSANPKTSSLLIERSRQSRVAKNNNPELLKTARQDCQKQQGRVAKNDNQRIPIEKIRQRLWVVPYLMAGIAAHCRRRRRRYLISWRLSAGSVASRKAC